MPTSIYISFLVYNYVAFITSGMTIQEMEGHPRFKFLPKITACSLPVIPHGSKILNGNQTDIGKNPWFGQLGYALNGCPGLTNEVSYDCSCSLISPTHLLTAAHCAPIDMYGECQSTTTLSKVVVVHVKLGAWNHNPKKLACTGQACADGVQLLPVRRIVVHESYIALKMNDIAIVLLRTPARITHSVSPICLPIGEMLNKNVTGLKADVIGWARPKINGEYSDEIIYELVTIPIIPEERCSKKWLDLGYVPRGILCAGDEDEGNVCYGESGGSLMFINDDKKMYLVGFVSIASDMCGVVGDVVVYSNIMYFMKWILNHLI